MLPNPYTPGRTPRVFVGRQAERRQLRDDLAKVAAYGEMMGPLTIVTGPRGLGKTSLLREVQARAREDGFVVAWTAGVRHQPFLADVLAAVADELRRLDILDTAPGRRVEELGLEVGAGFAKVSAKVRPRQAVAAPGLVRPVEAFFEGAGAAVRARGGAGLVVMIDELHEPLESTAADAYTPDAGARVDAAVLLNATQNMDGERERYPLAFIGAGLPQTKALLTRAATFGERVREHVLTEVDDATAREMLEAPAAQLGVGWTARALDLATDFAAGYPQSLQIVGEAAWDAARPEAGDPIGVDAIRQGGGAVAAQISSMFEARWANATPAERAFLRAMAAHSDSTVRRGVVAAELGVATTALSVARRSLINKGIIESPDHGQLRFTIPGFAEFVRRQAHR